MGNPLLGDDRVGWEIAERLSTVLSYPAERERISQDIEIERLSLGGLSLMERLEGYDWAILLDAITTGEVPIGTVTTMPLEALHDHSSGHLSSAHDTTLQTAIKFGRSMGLSLPERVSVVAVEAQVTLDITEALSTPVADAVPFAVQAVLDLLHHNGAHRTNHQGE